MKELIRLFSFLPFIDRAFKRKYYASGVGVYVVNSIFKRIFRINATADFLVNYASFTNQPKKIIIADKDTNESVYKCFASSGFCYYQAINGIYIGKGTIWAPGCQFISANHSYKELSKSLPAPPIRIGNYVWIGGNVNILPSVEIGDYSVIGAGSVVTKKIEAYTIAAGSPAKPIARRCKKCLDKIPLTEEFCNNCK